MKHATNNIYTAHWQIWRSFTTTQLTICQHDLLLQPTRLYLNQCRPRCRTPCYITRPEFVKLDCPEKLQKLRIGVISYNLKLEKTVCMCVCRYVRPNCYLPLHSIKHIFIYRQLSHWNSFEDLTPVYFIYGGDTRRFHLRGSDLHTSCRDFTTPQLTRIVASIMN